MFQHWFTNKCTAIVGEDGRALSGPALEAAKADRYHKVCGHLVKTRAKFCSKCGAPAPGSWWRCSSCNQWIGIESKTCPHCGKVQNVSARLDMADGVWKKGDDVFAQKFESLDVRELMKKGLVIQEGQCAILLEGGAVCDVLPPGQYDTETIVSLQNYLTSGKAKSFVMVDESEVPFPVQVNDIKTKEDLNVDLKCVAVIQFNHEKPIDFLSNVMGNRAYVSEKELNKSLGYDDLARYVIADIDLATRDFVVSHGIDELFKDPKLRLQLEDTIAEQLDRNMDAAGMKFMRLKEVEFTSELYDELRAKNGDIETKRREIEFQMRADELANDATKRAAMTESEMQDYMDQLAHEKDVKDYVRADEMARLGEKWKYDRAKAEQDAVDSFEENDVRHANELKLLELKGEIERRQKEHEELIRQRLAEQEASLEYEKIEDTIQRMQIDRKVYEATHWQQILQRMEDHDQEIEEKRIESYKGVSSVALTAAIDDPIRGERVAKLAELELQKGMSPELLLAAAAAKGIPEAVKALASMTSEKQAIIEKAKEENKELYEKMLAMNERMFNQATEKMSKEFSSQPATTIVK